MKGITLCADCAYYNMKKHKCTRGCKIDPDVSKGENPSFYVDCPLPDVEPVQKWIPCSERLPAGRKRVLATTDEGAVIDVIFVLKGSQWFRNGEYFPFERVIAWMPLPDSYEPPKEGEHNGTESN